MSRDPSRTEAAMSAVLEQIESYISMLPNVPEEVLTMVRSVEEPGWLADLIAFSPEFTSAQRQQLLEVLDPIDRLRQLSVMIQKRLNVLNLRHEIQTEAQAGMDRQQREYFLREQLRAIQKELGEGSSEEALANEIRAEDRSGGHAGRGEGQGPHPGRAARAAASVLPGNRRDPHLSRMADRTAVGGGNRRPARPRRSRPHP